MRGPSKRKRVLQQDHTGAVHVMPGIIIVQNDAEQRYNLVGGCLVGKTYPWRSEVCEDADTTTEVKTEGRSSACLCVSLPVRVFTSLCSKRQGIRSAATNDAQAPLLTAAGDETAAAPASSGQPADISQEPAMPAVVALQPSGLSRTRVVTVSACAKLNGLCGGPAMVSSARNAVACEPSSHIPGGTAWVRTFFRLVKPSGGGNTLHYSERKLLGYSQEQMFEVVSRVEFYRDFVPWCTQSRVTARSPHALTAYMKVGFPPIVESYTSHVTLVRPTLVKVGAVGYFDTR
ncbi:hypothetical protein MTO96_031459 [Rhipicephalus appendiculatus]